MAYYCHFVQQEFGPAERCHTQSLIAADVTTASPQALLLTQMRFGANANAVSCVTRILFPSVVPWFRIYSSHKLVWSIVNAIRRQCSHHSIGLGPDDVKSTIEYRFSQSLRPDVPAGMGLTGFVCDVCVCQQPPIDTRHWQQWTSLFSSCSSSCLPVSITPASLSVIINIIPSFVGYSNCLDSNFCFLSSISSLRCKTINKLSGSG